MTDLIMTEPGIIQYRSTLDGEVKTHSFFDVPPGEEIVLPDDVKFILDWGFPFDGKSRPIKLPSGLIEVPESPPFYITNMHAFFKNCSMLVGENLSKWDVEHITNMTEMFYGCSSFNADISDWDVSNVSNMDGMFLGASKFNQDLSGWNVIAISQEPKEFDSGADNWTLPRPAWGTNAGEVLDLTKLDYDTVKDESIEKGFIKYRKKFDSETLKYEIVEFFNTLPDDAVHIVNWGETDLENVRLSMSPNLISVPDHAPPYINHMGGFFNKCRFFNHENVSNWDVSGIKSISSVFRDCVEFNQPLDKWDVSNIVDMSSAFSGCLVFNQDISGWNVSNVFNMLMMFNGAISFNQDLSNWDVSRISEEPTDFAMDVEGWVLPKPRWGKIMVDDSIEKGFIKFKDGDGVIGKGPIELNDITTIPYEAVEIINWGTLDEVIDQGIEVSYPITTVPKDAPKWTTNFKDMFEHNTTFNDPNVSEWDVSHVKNMCEMFQNAESFNQDIGNWDVSNVETMEYMFYRSYVFNQDIGKWNVSNVKNMYQMFYEAYSFNQDIGNWDVSNVETMEYMFYRSYAFNQDIGKWNVSNVKNMGGMFHDAESFNQDIGNWDVSNVKTMSYMFQDAKSFNQDISGWDVSNVRGMSSMFRGAESFNQDLSYWDVRNIPKKPQGFDEGAIKWTLPRPIWGTNGGDVKPIEGKIQYVTMDTNKVGSIDIVDGITIVPDTYRVLDWGYVSNPKEGVTYSVKLPKNIVNIPTTEPNYITSMDGMFEDCSAFTGKNLETWNTSKVTSMNNTFKGCSSINVDLSKWDVSNVKSFKQCFESVSMEGVLYSIKDWDVSSCENFQGMFLRASFVNYIPIHFWNVKNAKNMEEMFSSTDFNIDLSTWDVEHIPKEPNEFSIFNNNWDLPKPLWGKKPELAKFKSLELLSEKNNILKYKVITNFPIPENLTVNDAIKVEEDGIFEVTIPEGFHGEFKLVLKSNDSRYVDVTEFSHTVELPELGVGELLYGVNDSLVKITPITFDDQGVFTLPSDATEVIDWGTINDDSNLKGKDLSIKCPPIITKVPNTAPPYITSMDHMFDACILFKGEELATWTVTNITSMNATFKGTKSLNVDLSKWDVSNVISMKETFMDSGIVQ